MIYQGGVQGFPRASHAPILGSELLHSPMECPLSGLQPPHLQGTGAAVRDPNRQFATANCRTAKGLLDHLVGKREERLRNCEAERLGGFEVDH